MQLRSFIFLGLCAALGANSPAFAGVPANMAAHQSVEKTDAIKVAAKSDTAQLKLLKKKKNPTPDDLLCHPNPPGCTGDQKAPAQPAP